MVLELVIGGSLAIYFFYKQYDVDKKNATLLEKRKNIVFQETVFALKRIWFNAQSIIVNCQINGFGDELDEKFPTHGMIFEIIKVHKNQFYVNIQHIRTLVTGSSDAIDPPELIQKLLGLCNDMNERISREEFRFSNRWSVITKQISEFVKTDFPTYYNSFDFDDTMFSSITKKPE